MLELYEEFPSLCNNMIAIKKMTDSDAKTLFKNGFIKKNYTVQEKNWSGHDAVYIDVYIRKTTNE